MTITLTPMQIEDFRTYLTYTTKHYAKEKIKAGSWLPEEAMLLSKQTFLICCRMGCKRIITICGVSS